MSLNTILVNSLINCKLGKITVIENNSIALEINILRLRRIRVIKCRKSIDNGYRYLFERINSSSIFITEIVHLLYFNAVSSEVTHFALNITSSSGCEDSARGSRATNGFNWEMCARKLLSSKLFARR